MAKKTSAKPKREKAKRHTQSAAEPANESDILSKNQLRLFVFLGLLALGFVGFIPIMSIFLVPIILAATFTTLMYPVYQWVLARFGGRKGLAAITTTLGLIIVVVGPLYAIAYLIVEELNLFVNTIAPDIISFFESSELDFEIGEVLPESFANFLTQFNLQFETFQFDVNWQSIIERASSMTGNLITRTSAGAFELFSTLFVTLFSMFYLFRDGDKLLERLRFLSPLRPYDEELMFSRFTAISRATIRGTVLIGAIQGTLGAIVMLIFGIRGWILLGAAMVVLSILPMVGGWIVLTPVAIWQFIQGNIVAGVAITIAMLVITNGDNLVRPRLVGSSSKMHDLMIFFSSIGGIALFGIMGFIVGPVIVAFFLSVLDIYGSEFKSQLLQSQKDNPLIDADEG